MHFLYVSIVIGEKLEQLGLFITLKSWNKRKTPCPLKQAHQQCPNCRFVMNLAVSNLLTSTTLNALLIFDIAGNLGYTRVPCMLSEAATALVTTSSVLSVLLIAVDQYFAVVDPLRYRTRIDKLKCALLILFVWSFCSLFGLLAAFNPNPRSAWKICSGSAFPEDDTYLTYGLLYALAYTLFAYLVPFIGVCWVYVRIYTAARKNSERTRRTGSRPMLSSGSFCEDHLRAAAGTYIKLHTCTNFGLRLHWR